jgi:hypothetical protein
MELLSGTIRLDYLLMLVQEPEPNMRKESKQACLNYGSRDPEPKWPEST